YWLSQQISRGQKPVADAEKVIWSLVLPHMTEKGLASFKQHYGLAFYNQLGEPFDVDKYSMITF
ncbi:MAG: hypothetical protein KJP00_09310, partial [Bacteroidia bacterium]|nr:hypothetical protein [Bacteroidia bacterium]